MGSPSRSVASVEDDKSRAKDCQPAREWGYWSGLLSFPVSSGLYVLKRFVGATSVRRLTTFLIMECVHSLWDRRAGLGVMAQRALIRVSRKVVNRSVDSSFMASVSIPYSFPLTHRTLANATNTQVPAVSRTFIEQTSPAWSGKVPKTRQPADDTLVTAPDPAWVVVS